MLVKIYRGFGIGIVGLYLTATLLGWELASAKRERLDPSARSGPGGYRSSTFWHSGYHGGK